jgi:hypothetical protein
MGINRLGKFGTLVLVFTASAHGQSEMRLILERLEAIEAQNRELAKEVRALRTELAASRRPATTPAEATAEAPPLGERLAVQESRIEEHAQSKVESGQKLPVRLRGMVLFNAFTNGAYSGTSQYPTAAAQEAGSRNSGASFRQSTLGLEFDGGRTIGNGKLSGYLFLDFFGGSASPLNHLVRIRTAAARLDWRNTSIIVGQEKPMFSVRDPVSLAQVGISPLTGAGNPWLWQPQIKVERRFSFGEEFGLTAQIGVLQTNEQAANVPQQFASTLARARPALEGRFEFRLRNLDLAPGFHWSTTHVAGTSVPSNAFSLDWQYSPWRGVQFTGLAFTGANLANLGTLRQGFTVLGPGRAIAVRTRGGWAQVALTPTNRLSFHLMAGQQDDRNSDLRSEGIGKNQAYAANVMYRLSPSVILALEAGQVRTTYIPGQIRRNNHYDLAIGYLF